MNPFSGPQLVALRQLRGAWRPEQFIVIGAAALGCFLEMRWRRTADLDLTVAVTLAEVSAVLGALPGWVRDPRVEHRWRVPGEAAIDVIPAGPELLRQGEILWPKSGQRMELVGFRLPFAHGVPIEVEPGSVVRVAPLPVLFVLKAIAALDRVAERERDLADLAHILEGFEPADPEERFSPAVFEAKLTYEEVGPFLLGREISVIVNEAERERVEAWMRAAATEEGPGGLQPRLLAMGPAAWRRSPHDLLRSLDAFGRGLGR
jgi:predicted nucleotidyltransferase